MSQQIVISRKQIEQIAVYLALNSNIKAVTIKQDHSSGIGAGLWVVYQTDLTEWQEEITDVSEW